MKKRYRKFFFVFDNHPMLLFAVSIIISFLIYYVPFFGLTDRPFNVDNAFVFLLVVIIVTTVLGAVLLETAIRCDYYKVLKRYKSVKYLRELPYYAKKPL